MSARHASLTKRTAQSTESPGASGYALATLVAIFGWFLAGMIIAARQYTVVTYQVLDPFAGLPVGWSLLGAQTPQILLLALIGTGHYFGLVHGRSTDDRSYAPLGWLAICLVIPLLDAARASGVAVPLTYWEPIGFAFASGLSARHWRFSSGTRYENRGSQIVICLVAVAATATWYILQTEHYFQRYLLGFNDFGQFALRVVNTVQGRGFLIETAGLPRFWDHFNPGLGIFVPFWRLFEDTRVFFLAQAFCLALPALFVYLTARRLGSSRLVANVWAIAFLANPVISQMNVNYTYGWHPVSTALLLLCVAGWLLVSKRFVSAFLVALGACTFKENVILVLGLFSASMALAAWIYRDRSHPVIHRLSARIWLCLAIGFFVLFWGVYHWSGLADFQTDRFGRLGHSTLEIILSPITKPGLFWSEVFKFRSLCFVAIVGLPMAGTWSWNRSLWVAAATILPLAVLLAWDHGPATSIGFQYSTTLWPFIFLAILSSSAIRAQAAYYAMVASLGASLAFGGHVFSSPTLNDVLLATYGFVPDRQVSQERAPGGAAHVFLEQWIGEIRQAEDSSTLATGRVAGHLLGVDRLETVGQATLRWQSYAQRGPPLDQFRWIILDTLEQFQQSPDETRFIWRQAETSGFVVLAEQAGIMILRRKD